MGRTRYFNQKPLTPAEQAYVLKLKYPGFRILTARNHLECVGTLQPTLISDAYTVKIIYNVPLRPRVQVLQPELRLAPGKTRLPHVFEGNELCLHDAEDWHPGRHISEYVVPWISLWLAFYEFWVLTGEWRGDGREPSVEKK